MLRTLKTRAPRHGRRSFQNLANVRCVVAAVAFLGLWPDVAWAQHDHGAEGVAPVASPATSPAQVPAAPGDAHAGHQSGGPAPLPPFIPAVTDADRAAAFPDVGGHMPHGESFTTFVMADHLEWRSGRGADGVEVDLKGWVGGDLSRLWFRTSGAIRERDLVDARVELFYGRPISRWWDVVMGVRQDVEPGLTRTWAAIGLQGLAPQWFELEATAYLGAGGRTQLHLASEYDLLLTNRLVLQPSAALDVYGKADAPQRIGAGFSSVEAAVRLRYEIRREFAPYIGVAWERAVFETADQRRAVGDRVAERRFVAGLRVWF